MKSKDKAILEGAGAVFLGDSPEFRLGALLDIRGENKTLLLWVHYLLGIEFQELECSILPQESKKPSQREESSPI